MNECSCGNVVCCGPIARRALSLSPTDLDLFFLNVVFTESAEVDCLKVDLKLIRSVNDHFRTVDITSPTINVLKDVVRQLSQRKNPPKLSPVLLKQCILRGNDVQYESEYMDEMMQ